MLKEIKLIQNIGRFEVAKPTRDATFGGCTLIFGENGWGKSTLADILRSLTTNNPAILVGRRTVDADAPSKAVLRIGTQNAVFENGAWAGPRPRIAVYDSAFINDNVFSGDIVSADHLKNQYGLVVGEEGVRRVRRLVELDEENRANNGVIREAEAALNSVIRSVGPPTMKLDDFLALEARPDINEAIAEQDAKVQRVRRAAEIKAAADPALFPIPTEGGILRNLLTKSVDGIAEEALAKVRAHIATHEGHGQRADTAHETWLETGTAFVRTDNCPFCGQPLTDRTLVDAYRDIFSAAYKELAASVKKIRDTLGRYGNGDFRQAVSHLAEQNTGHFRYWQEAAKIDVPTIGEDINSAIAPMENAAARLDALFAQKQANITEAIVANEAEDALAAWEKGRTQLTAINAQIGALLATIKSVKESINPAALSALENELKLLHVTKHRHEPETMTQVGSLIASRIRKNNIAKEKAEVRKALDEHGQTITAELGISINSYLKRLAAGFRIDYKPPDYRGKEPSASYNILIREVPVAPRSVAGEIDKPSFRNTLSGGDKSTLALALFLAKVNAEPDLAEAIVVLDDPFTSLDEFRRRFTAIEIRKLCGRAMQTIVLSHEKHFLRHLWEKIDHGIISSIALQTGAPGITTIAPYDIQAETRPRHVSERMKLDEFVEGEPHDPSHVRTRLRTVCEHFYRSGDPSLFAANASLDQIIRALDGASDEHPYKGALEDLRDINEYSRDDSHAAVRGDQSEESSIEELKEWCRRVLDLTRGM